MKPGAFLLVLLSAATCAAQGSTDAVTAQLHEVEELLRDEPEDLDKQEAAFKKLKELSGDSDVALLLDVRQYLDQRRKQVEAVRDALHEIRMAHAEFQADKDSSKAAVRWKKAHDEVGARWFGDRQQEWHGLLVMLIGDLTAEAKAERAKGEPDWIRIALALRLAGDICGDVPPDRYPAQDAQALARDRDEATEKLYLETKWADALPAKDMLAESVEWKQDEWIDVERKDGTVTLSNPADKVGLFWLNQEVGWQDYILDMQFTCNDRAFQVYQRYRGESHAAATHDLAMFLAQGGIKADEKSPRLGFMVFGGKNQVLLDGRRAHPRPQRCAPSGSRAGGFAFRLPPGAKVVLHALSVKVLREE